MPPAFILSQDQTLHCKKFDRPFSGRFILVQLLTQYQGASRLIGKPYTILRSFEMTSRICIALFNFQGASPFSGQQDITLHHFFYFANRSVDFFDFFDYSNENCLVKAACFKGEIYYNCKWRFCKSVPHFLGKMYYFIINECRGKKYYL